MGFAIDRDGERIRFAVADTGRGIREEDLGQLFQPFRRMDDPDQATEGAGLGLVISRRLVELLGGELRVESTFGRGSRFWFALPLPATDAPERAPTAPTAPIIGYRGPRRRVLIADDKRENLSLIHIYPLLHKPVQPAQLRSALHHLLHLREREREPLD